jgi:pimeloyl-ACP methyl ester carboxylesterase
VSRSVNGLLQAQARAAVVLASTLDVPGIRVPARMSRAPRRDDVVLAGTATTIVRPSGPPPWPTLVFANGATPDGRTHPAVLRLGRALARPGHLVLIPDLPGISVGELSPATLAAAIALTRAAVDKPEAADGRVALAGVSVGGSLALLTAADPGLAGRISVIACIAPYTDLAKVMLLATTGMYRDGDRLEAYAVPDYLGVGLARSLAAMLTPTPAVDALRDELRALDHASADPLAPYRERSFDALGDEAARLFSLLTNRDPARFDHLYAALPGHVRSTVEALSPLRAAARLRAPVEIATAPRDRYFPVAESRALVRVSPHVRLTVTSLLAHATPRLSPRYLAELGRLNGFFVRALAAAREQAA